jgi:hypothetical protein
LVLLVCGSTSCLLDVLLSGFFLYTGLLCSRERLAMLYVIGFSKTELGLFNCFRGK